MSGYRCFADVLEHEYRYVPQELEIIKRLPENKKNPGDSRKGRGAQAEGNGRKLT